MSMKLTDKQKKFLELFVVNMGNIKQTCAKVKMNRDTYYAWYNNDKSDTFKREADSVFEGLIDDTESQLHANIQNGKEASIFFFLKTRAKHRGYIEKSELDIVAQQKVEYYAPEKDKE